MYVLSSLSLVKFAAQAKALSMYSIWIHSWHEKGWIGTLAINKAIQNILIIEFTHVTVTFHWITIPSICPKKNCKLKIFTATNRSSNFQFKLHINLAGRWVLMFWFSSFIQCSAGRVSLFNRYI